MRRGSGVAIATTVAERFSSIRSAMLQAIKPGPSRRGYVAQSEHNARGAAAQRAVRRDYVWPNAGGRIIYAQLNLTTTYVLDRQANRSQAHAKVLRDAS